MKNKKLLIGGLSIALIGLGSLSLVSKPTYQVIDNNNLDTEKIAVYIKNENGNYEKSNSIPTSGYTLNTEKSTCNNGTIPSWNKSNNSLKLNNLSGNTSCYLYFDEVPTTKVVNTVLGNLTVNLVKPDFSQIADTDEGIFEEEDGMYEGYSYYWRGAVENNYVKFAGYCWRIIRINGDGSIRLIYDGTTCHTNGTSTDESIAVTSQPYNASYDRSEYVGYTFTEGSQRGTTTESNLKSQTETWFNPKITGTKLGKVADGYFCNDRNTASGSTWSSQPSDTFYYAGYDRSGAKTASNVTPTLSCANASDKYTLKVGAITMDEVIMAGAKWQTANSSYYLYNGQHYWTMSPLYWLGDINVFRVNNDGRLINTYVSWTNPGIRPVINLKSDVTFVSGGNGTINNPYVVEGAE